MTLTIQQFLASSTRKAAADLTDAFLALPDNRYEFSPGGNARSAIDMVAECALNNYYTVELLRSGQFLAGDQEKYKAEKRRVAAEGWDPLKALLDYNTEVVIEAILSISDERLLDEITLPWGKSSIIETLVYPFWNMSYHLGQINAIALQLEVVK